MARRARKKVTAQRRAKPARRTSVASHVSKHVRALGATLKRSIAAALAAAMSKPRPAAGAPARPKKAKNAGGRPAGHKRGCGCFSLTAGTPSAAGQLPPRLPRSANPLLAIVGNRPGRKLDVSRVPHIQQAVRDCKEFNGSAKTVRVIRVDDGKRGVTRKAVSYHGHATAHAYKVKAKTFKGQKEYEHVWENDPINVRDPETGIVWTVPTKRGHKLVRRGWLEG